MKKGRQTARRIWGIVSKLVPFLIGMYCYYPIFCAQEVHLYPLLDTIYSAIKLYSGSVEGDVPVGLLLQIGRYWGLLVSLTVLAQIFHRMRDLVNWAKLLGPDVSVVYGDSAYADYAFESLAPRRRIRGEDKLIEGAARYLLMFSSDEKNLAFLPATMRRCRAKRYTSCWTA